MFHSKFTTTFHNPIIVLKVLDEMEREVNAYGSHGDLSMLTNNVNILLGLLNYPSLADDATRERFNAAVSELFTDMYQRGIDVRRETAALQFPDEWYAQRWRIPNLSGEGPGSTYVPSMASIFASRQRAGPSAPSLLSWPVFQSEPQREPTFGERFRGFLRAVFEPVPSPAAEPAAQIANTYDGDSADITPRIAYEPPERDTGVFWDNSPGGTAVGFQMMETSAKYAAERESRQ